MSFEALMNIRNITKTKSPADAEIRRSAKAIVCYKVDSLPKFDMDLYLSARRSMEKTAEVIIPPRDGATFEVPAGHFFRIVSIEGSQVGDLNLWNAADLSERFYSGKTRQLHASHVRQVIAYGAICEASVQWQLLHTTPLIGMDGMKMVQACMMLSGRDATLILTIY